MTRGSDSFRKRMKQYSRDELHLNENQTQNQSGYSETWKVNTVEKPAGLKQHMVWDDRLAAAITV